MFSGLAYLVFLYPVSRATGSCTRTFPIPASCVSLTVQIWTVDSSLDICLSPVSPFVLSTCTLTFLAYTFPLLSRRLVSMLTITAYAFPFVVCRLVSRLVISGL